MEPALSPTPDPTVAITGLISWLIQNYNYFTTPAVLLTIIGCTWFISSRISAFQTKFTITSGKVSQMEKVINKLNNCMVEVQTFVKGKYEGSSFMEVLGMYGEANSPIVLRDEFRSYIQESGIAVQVEDNKTKLVNWLKRKKPLTGLDAQKLIIDLVISDKIEEYIDTTELKKLLYGSGKVIRDYYAIICIYLFETIIPEVIKD